MCAKRKNPWRLIRRKGRYIQVVFDHIPGGCFSAGTLDEFEANKWAEEKWLRDMGRLSKAKPQAVTLQDFAKDFFTPSDPKGFIRRQIARGYVLDPSEYRRRQAYLDNYILKAHGKWLLDAISDVMIEDFIIGLRKFNDRRKSLSSDTKNKVLAAYNDVMKEAKREGLISINPCDTVGKMAQRHEERLPFTDDEMKRLFPEDRNRLLYIWGTLQWAVYFLMLRDTGFRPGELSGLSVRNYYPEFRGVYTTGSVHWSTHKLKDTIKTSKQGLKYREGFLSETTANYLEEMIRYNPDKEYLFKINGEFIIPNTANKHLRASAARAGIEIGSRTQYSFRHSFQSYFIGRMPEEARLVLMGHTRTRSNYTHLTPEQRLRRVLEIEGVSEVLDSR